MEEIVQKKRRKTLLSGKAADINMLATDATKLASSLGSIIRKSSDSGGKKALEEARIEMEKQENDDAQNLQVKTVIEHDTSPTPISTKQQTLLIKSLILPLSAVVLSFILFFLFAL